MENNMLNKKQVLQITYQNLSMIQIPCSMVNTVGKDINGAMQNINIVLQMIEAEEKAQKEAQEKEQSEAQEGKEDGNAEAEEREDD